MEPVNQSGPINKIAWSDRIDTTVANKKACFCNLIIYVDEARRATYFQDIVRLITSQFPSRVIFIWKDEGEKAPFIRMKQSADLKIDQYLIEASPSYLSRVPFLILPILAADVPIYLLWGQDPTTDETILPSLEKFATKLIFDSESAENLQLFSKNMLTHSSASKIEIADMNWSRIGGWREILTRTFDCPERIDQLKEASQIKIIYNSRPSDLSIHPATQALYLQAWLAAQLNWRVKSFEQHGNDFTIVHNSNNRTVEIKIHGEVRKDILPQEIIGFEAVDASNFLYSLTRKTEKQVVVHCNTLDRCELPFTLFLPNLLTSRNFMQEVFYKKTSPQYFNMLKIISQIKWK